MEVIKYQKEHNIIQECGENEKGYFMPFRAVVRRDKLSTQVRMVFNCSSCEKGNLSLNDCLDQGPNLNPSVLDIILGNGLCEENSFEKDNKLKVLGLVWNLEEDMLRVDVTSLLESFKFLENTKRSVLSTAAKVFDPVGFLSPFVVRNKRLMQEIWERGLDWDSKLPEDLESKWKKWCVEIEVLCEMKIERCYFSNVVGKLDSVEVHIFSDASIVAYGAVAYFRLELMGALIAARLWKYLSNVFCGLVDGGPVWLRGSRNQWPKQKFERVTDEQKLEKLNTSVHAILPQTEMILDENKFSNLRKLLRVAAWVKRFVAKLRKKKKDLREWNVECCRD
ncbi:reverse transcriptase [Caerostris extrusa]|uniref:Reverse transcriptase n=1 Tax=Caerostris extrusa TaxID=172846 RepID=A0AAV4M6A6_CAEEX|nr:reverse transcriptase [Caerostris extrusa]